MPFVVGALLVGIAIAALPHRPGIVRFTPVPLDRDHPERRRIGALTHLGSWRLTSDAPGFGGISSIRIVGGNVTALTDASILLKFRFDPAAGQAALARRPLPGIYTPGNDSPDRDSESLAFDPATGAAWVGFETSNAIRRFSPGFSDKKGWAIPALMAGWPENLGPEAMARLADGRLIVFSEATPGPRGTLEAVLLSADPTRAGSSATRFLYRPPEGFRPTDAAQLADGRLLVLNRSFSFRTGVAAALVLLDPRRIAAGAIVGGREIARLAPPLVIDNMEGLAIEQASKRGRVIVWLASDDNFNPFQQTLLMRFALDLQRVR